MSISVVTLYNTTVQFLKAGTSGYTNQSEWNNVLETVQLEAMETMAANYENNSRVQEAVSPFAVDLPALYTVNGLAKPTGFFQLASISAGGFPVYPIKVNQVAYINNSPVREPSTADGRYYYYMKNNKINLLPNIAVAIAGVYLKRPAVASIVLTPVSATNSDYLVPSAGADLEWPQSVYNLILYMMLEKMGVQQKEQVIIQWSNLGIQKELMLNKS